MFDFEAESVIHARIEIVDRQLTVNLSVGEVDVVGERVTDVTLGTFPSPAITTIGFAAATSGPANATQRIDNFVLTRSVPNLVFATAEPPAHPVDGGTSIEFGGSGFHGDLQFLIGGERVEDLDLVNSCLMRGTTPPLPAGVYDVTVENVFDSTVATLEGAVTYSQRCDRSGPVVSCAPCPPLLDYDEPPLVAELSL